MKVYLCSLLIYDLGTKNKTASYSYYRRTPPYIKKTYIKLTHPLRLINEVDESEGRGGGGDSIKRRLTSHSATSSPRQGYIFFCWPSNFFPLRIMHIWFQRYPTPENFLPRTGSYFSDLCPYWLYVDPDPKLKTIIFYEKKLCWLNFALPFIRIHRPKWMRIRPDPDPYHCLFWFLLIIRCLCTYFIERRSESKLVEGKGKNTPKVLQLWFIK